MAQYIYIIFFAKYIMSSFLAYRESLELNLWTSKSV